MACWAQNMRAMLDCPSWCHSRHGITFIASYPRGGMSKYQRLSQHDLQPNRRSKPSTPSPTLYRVRMTGNTKDGTSYPPSTPDYLVGVCPSGPPTQAPSFCANPFVHTPTNMALPRPGASSSQSHAKQWPSAGLSNDD